MKQRPINRSTKSSKRKSSMGFSFSVDMNANGNEENGDETEVDDGVD